MLPSMLMSWLSWTSNGIVITCYCGCLDKISAFYLIVLTVICFRDVTSACSEMCGWLIAGSVFRSWVEFAKLERKIQRYCLWLGKFPSHLWLGAGRVYWDSCPCKLVLFYTLP